MTKTVVKTTYSVPIWPARPEEFETQVEISLGDKAADREVRGEVWRGPWLQLRADPGDGSCACLNCYHEECCGGFRLPVEALKIFLEQNPGVLE